MNNKILLIGAAALAVSMQSCKDDQEFDNGSRLPEGTEIEFGAGLTEQKSRTYYGGDGNLNLASWPIYWNYETGTQDEIFLYSPDSPTGRDQGVYRVDCTAADKSTESNVVRVSDNPGVQTSEAQTYSFYGLYPAKFVQGRAENRIIKANLPETQTVTFGGTKEDPTMTVVPAGQTGTRNFVMKPNMDYCIMTGVSNDVTLTADQKVTVPFTPFSTMLDITINGPDNNTAVDNGLSRITSVIIEANAPICGDFSVNYSSGAPVLELGENTSNTITIPVRGEDSEGDPVGIPLMNENTLNLKAFILPNTNVSDIKVKVVSQNMKTWTKTLHVNNNLLRPHEIHPVNLPILDLANAKVDYSIWLSQLDPRIYISELSLPGSCMSFNTEANNVTGTNITQTADIAEQFKAGVRVFQAHCWLVDQPSNYDGDSPTFHIVTPSGGDTRKSLWDIVDALQTEMKENHGNEFCVLMLSDYMSGTTFNMVNYYDRIKTLTNAMQTNNVLPENAITPNTTIADVRGKIILKFAVNGARGSDTNLATRMNNVLTKLKAAEQVNGARCLFNMYVAYANSNVCYSPLTFGTMGSFTFDNATAGWGGGMAHVAVITSSTPGMNTAAAQEIIRTSREGETLAGSSIGSAEALYNNANTLPSWADMMYVYSEQAEAGANYDESIANINHMVSAINSSYDSGTHNKFFMTYVGGKGSSTPGNRHSVASITQNFNQRWLDQINSYFANKNSSYGWVLFNDIQGTIYTSNEANAPTTPNCITKVIENNVKEGFKLRRRK